MLHAMVLSFFFIVEDQEMTNFEKKENSFNQYIDDKSFHYEEYAKREKKDSDVFRAHVISFSLKTSFK